MPWSSVVASAALSANSAFGTNFLAVYGARNWLPGEADRSAARKFHIELISRIATQPLGYGEGVEERALTSIFELFPKSRDITEQNPGCATFETLVWYVLNAHVRPFTAKWHSRSSAGALKALDSSDDFRAELVAVQAALIDLDTVLRVVSGDVGYLIDRNTRPDRKAVVEEMAKSVRWRPLGLPLANRTEDDARASEAPAPLPPAIDADLATLARAERESVKRRRLHYRLALEQKWASGLALSGGGIRSATFSLGVMVSLAKRNLLPQFDYLSTVSGGGYSGSFLTQLLGKAGENSVLGLRGGEQPFARDNGESEILRRIRQNASYLSGSFGERLALIMAQANGVFLNLLVLSLVSALFGFCEYLLRSYVSETFAIWLPILSLAFVMVVFILTPLLRRIGTTTGPSDKLMAALGCIILIPIVWIILGAAHETWTLVLTRAAHWDSGKDKLWMTLNAARNALAALTSALAIAGSALAVLSKLRPALLSLLIGALFLILETLAFQTYGEVGAVSAALAAVAEAAVLAYLWIAVDVNATSLHAYYRAKLAAAFLIDRNGDPAAPILMSGFDSACAHFPIVNCALNLPGSRDSAMRGRLCDVFAITPVATGAGVLRHMSTLAWEQANPKLDLATAMALSGAAVSPQMGLRTTRYASFWLTTLNLRLGLWLRKPGEKPARAWGPGVKQLLRELTATADERGDFVNISDGGHIENLGVYELLRRRCRFIVAIDGESDPSMTFHALTNLQRLAYIDFGIVLEADLDDLRLNASGLSRSHFRFCRILYPRGRQDGDVEIGYLIYLKLSLTGNEGEFIKRYKLDEPAFPHHSTADQFFSESQFEAYRALGEHVGEKLFLPAITGDLGDDVDLEHWMSLLGSSLLDAPSHAKRGQPARAP